MNDTAALPSTTEPATGSIEAIVSRTPAPGARSADIPVDLDDVHEQALIRLGRKGKPLPAA